MTAEQPAQSRSEDGETDASPTTALEVLFLELESPLHIYALKLTGRPDTAQDIVQEAFLRLHARFAEVREPKLWLYRTVRNLAMDHHRTTRKIVTVDFEKSGPDQLEPMDQGSAPDEEMARNEGIERARAGIANLDGRARELIRLKFEERLTYKEMGERTGLTPGYVGNILHHAIHQIAGEIRRDGGL